MTKRGTSLCTLLVGVLLTSVVYFTNNVYAEEPDNNTEIGADTFEVSDISAFYVCDEFLENGTAGGDIECSDMPNDAETTQGLLMGAASLGENLNNNATLNSAGLTIPTLKMSTEGIALLAGFEGCRLTAYKALGSEQYYTIGYGHYGPDVYPGMTITQDQALALLAQDVASREKYLNDFTRANNVLLRQNEFDAIVSLIYNIGTGNFSTSTIRRYILEGFTVHTDADFTYAISMWNKSGGQVINGLVNRRAKESAHFTRYGVKRPVYTSINAGLRGTVELNIYIDIPATMVTGNAYVEVTSPDGTVTKPLSSLERVAGFYRVQTVLRAKDVSSDVYMKLVDASGYVVPVINANTGDGYSFSYSLERYSNEVGAVGNASLVDLMAKMVVYGKCAKNYFGEGAYSAPTNVKSVSNGSFGQYTGQVSGGTPGVEYYGSSLLLKSNTYLRHYFVVSKDRNISEFVFEIWDDSNNRWQELTPQKRDDMYFVTITDIPPSYYDKMFNVRVRRRNVADATPLTVNYGIFSYANKVVTASSVDDKLVDVVKAMYLYHRSAKAYF